MQTSHIGLLAITLMQAPGVSTPRGLSCAVPKAPVCVTIDPTEMLVSSLSVNLWCADNFKLLGINAFQEYAEKFSGDNKAINPCVASVLLLPKDRLLLSIRHPDEAGLVRVSWYMTVT